MQIPESMKSTWENITNTNQKTGDVTLEQLEQLKYAANSDGKIDSEEQEFINYVESSLMVASNNNQGKGSNPINFVDTEFGKVPSSMVNTWNEVSADGIIDENDLEKLKKSAAPNGKNEEFDNDEINLFSNLLDKAQDGKVILNNQVQNNSGGATSPFGEVPASLQATWNQVSSDGEISLNDLNNLITAATPNEKPEEIDDQERAFLLKIKEAIEANNKNPISLSNNLNQSSGPTLLNWPGYTSQTKQALKDAYGEYAVGTKMPLLRNDAALQVAQSFGASDVRQLQSMIGAKVDGKFGPETYFKAKAYVANLMNTNSQDPRIPNMLSVLGNDIEVRKMIERYGANQINSSTQQNTQNNNQHPVNNDKPPVSIGDTDPNNPESIKSFQNKVNLLANLYNAQKGANLELVEVNGELTEPFADKLRNMEQKLGKPVAQAISEIENELKSKGFNKLDSRSVNFVKLAENGIQITGDVKDMIRVNAAKELLAKLGFNLTNFEISKPENPGVNGDLILKSGNFELKVFDNVSFDKRNHNKYGDLHIIGKYDNKDIDVFYWENDKRGEKSIKEFNRFHLKAKVNGQELEPIKQNESILSKPLIEVK